MSLYPQVDQIIPDFRLTAADGREFRMSMFRGHRDLVLIFTAGKSPRLVAELASRAEELEEENARVFVIAPALSAWLQDAADSFPVLIDSDLAVSRRFGADREPAVYITDQYGEIYAAHEGAALPSAGEVLASLRHINAACPE
jgi:peroxiredoxin